MFEKSDIGAKSAWKGFSTQTIYIASRIIESENNYYYYPEDIEDLVIKDTENKIIESVQVKNISSDLTISSLATTKSSKGGEGFYKRATMLHQTYPDLKMLKIVYFGRLGSEFEKLKDGDANIKTTLVNKLICNHDISKDDATWIINSLIFEKVDREKLEEMILGQIRQYVEVMAAPQIAKILLIQYVSELSENNGYTSLSIWIEKMKQLGIDISALDGYYKEYGKSLIRLSDISKTKSIEELKVEFSQGVSARPEHISNSIDFNRPFWIKKLSDAFSSTNTVIVKGVSGQGKSTLCLRYLYDTFPPESVFLVRGISSKEQAKNLVSAFQGISKYTKDIILYIDVNSAEVEWISIIKEMQFRGINLPVLVSIRDEDFNRVVIDHNFIELTSINLELTCEEAEIIFNKYTEHSPHPAFRDFEQIWETVVQGVPFIEFSYILSNNDTLKNRLKVQIDLLIKENIDDKWISLLYIVSFASFSGCSLKIEQLKKLLNCSNITSAIQRLNDEYLIRTVHNNKEVVALHPVRGEILYQILCDVVIESDVDLLMTLLIASRPSYHHLIMMNFFTIKPLTTDIITSIRSYDWNNWLTLSSIIKTMLWVDIKEYVDRNINAFKDIVASHGIGWLNYLPLNLNESADTPKHLFAEDHLKLDFVNKEAISKAIALSKTILTERTLTHKNCNLFLKGAILPSDIPTSDAEWSGLGYTLYWVSKKKQKCNMDFLTAEILIDKFSFGDIQSKADAIRGISEHTTLDQSVFEAINNRIFDEFVVLQFREFEDEVEYKFVPPTLNNQESNNKIKNFNHYWKIKLLKILEKLYPNKEYISIELLGVELLKDLNIEALDHKLRIATKNRPLIWNTELNLWVKLRVESNFRPQTWNQYIDQIIELRNIIEILTSKIITLVEFLYKKGRVNPNIMKEVTEHTKTFNAKRWSLRLYPVPISDKFCMFSEDMNENLHKNDFDTGGINISFGKYSGFKKAFDGYIRQYWNFIDQYQNVLLSRFNRTELEENSKLPLKNLLGSVKDFEVMIFEYDKLFSEYFSYTHDRIDKNIEDLLTLSNMINHVLKKPIQNISISYEAKNKYRKSSGKIFKLIDELSKSEQIQTSLIKDTLFIMKNIDLSAGDTIEKGYENIILQLQTHFIEVKKFSSEQHFFDTKIKIVYVPLYNFLPMSVGFRISNYFVIDEVGFDSKWAMFPDILPQPIYDIYKIDFNHCKEINLLLQKFWLITMWLRQYNDLQNNIFEDDIVMVGLEKYVNNFVRTFFNSVTEISKITDKSIELLKTGDNEILQSLMDNITSFLKLADNFKDTVKHLKPLEQLETVANNIVVALTILISDISKNNII